jgi:hypothetical protein
VSGFFTAAAVHFRPALTRRVPAQCAAYRTPRPRQPDPTHARLHTLARRRGPAHAAAAVLDWLLIDAAFSPLPRFNKGKRGLRLVPGSRRPAPRLHRLGGGTVEVVDWGRSTPNEMSTLNALRILRTGPASKTPSSQTS